MRRSVFSTINSMMKYSNGEDTTTLQILYLKLFRLFGMYLSRGLAPIVKSMQDFCNTAKQETNSQSVYHESESRTPANCVVMQLHFGADAPVAYFWYDA
jgi:hypothetical protein